MTKKNFMKVLDRIYWFVVTLFPFVVFVVLSAHNGQFITLETLFTNIGFGVNTSSPIYQTLYTLFGVGGGMLELVTGNGILLFATYFVTIELLHFIIDTLLVIVRWSHNLLDKATKE